MRRTQFGVHFGLYLVGAMGVVGFSSNAFASSWSNASGSNSAFGWTGGFNNTDHFGNPTVTPSGFFFDNTVNFIAVNPDGSTGDSETDFARTTFDVAASTPGGAPTISQIIVKEFGTWSSEISQPSDFTVQADFQLFRFVPGPPGTTGPLGMSVVFYPNGTWAASRTLIAGAPGNPPNSNLPWSRAQITVTNTIQVSGSAPAGSFIEKTGMQIITPEPGSALVMVVGLGTLLARRRQGR
jgi:hypothetical protein